METVRDFIVRTLLRDEAGKGLDALLAKATALTGKAFDINIGAVTKDAEKAIAHVEKAAKAAAAVDTSKTTKGLKEQSQATGGLAEKMSLLANNSTKMSNGVGNFFSKLDAGKLVVAGAAAGMIAYAKSALTVAESHRLNIDMIKEQLGVQSAAAMSFIAAGDQGTGTSSLTRGSLAGYMSMTGYKDEGQIQKNIANSEKIMSSTWGQSLAGFGITDEKGLMQALSNPIEETSDIGRIVKDKMPEFFKAGTLQTEKMNVQREDKFAFQSDAVVDAEARRRLASKAMEKIAGQVEPDSDSYRVGLKTFETSFDKLNEGIGNAVRPAAAVILTLMTAINRLLSLAPEVPILIAVVLGMGTAFATLGAIIPFVTAGMGAFSASLLANPVFLVVAAIALLAVGLSALENRTQIFSKAWDRFANSEIGKDLIGGVKDLANYLGLIGEGGDFFGGMVSGIESFAGRIGSLFDQVDNIYKMFKGGNLTGALAGGLSLAFRVTPIGMAAQFAESLLPSKRVQDMILFVLQKMKDLWDGFTRWLNDIWQVVAKFLDPILKIFQYIKELKERILGGGGLTGDTLKKAFIEALKSSGNAGLANASPEKAEAIYGAISGEKPLTQDEKSRLQISDIELADAKKAYDNLKSPAGTLGAGASTASGAFATGAKAGLDEATKEHSDKTNENLQDEKYGGSGFAAADWSVLTPLDYLYSGVKGAIGGVYDYVTTNAIGGEVTKSGLAWIDEGEPIVPAEVARSSVLIDSLKSIASGGGAGSSGGATVQIGEIKVIASGGDANSIARQIKEALLREMDDFSFKSRVEAIVHRADRAYIA